MLSVTVLLIAECILRVTDNLAKSLQATKLSAVDGRCMADVTVAHLQAMRDDDTYDSLYRDAVRRQQDNGWYIMLMHSEVAIEHFVCSLSYGAEHITII